MRWFGYLKRMSDEKIGKEVYKSRGNGNINLILEERFSVINIIVYYNKPILRTFISY